MSDSLRPLSQHDRPPVHHQLPEFTQTHVHRVSDAIQPSHPLSSPSPAPRSSQHQGLFQWVNSECGGPSIGVSALASVLPMNIQGWFPLGWTGWIPLQSKGLSRVFSNTWKGHSWAQRTDPCQGWLREGAVSDVHSTVPSLYRFPLLPSRISYFFSFESINFC